MDIKAKYSRVRGLAGLALKDVSQDGGLKCGDSLLETAYNGLSRQSRAPRQAILHSLEREILETPQNSLASIHVSPFRISRVIDVEGNWHVVRQVSRFFFYNKLWIFVCPSTKPMFSSSLFLGQKRTFAR